MKSELNNVVGYFTSFPPATARFPSFKKQFCTSIISKADFSSRPVTGGR